MAYGLFNSGGYYGGTPGMNTAPVYGFNPQQQPAQQQQNVGILWVQGESGAKSYLVAPGNTVQLMDSEVPRFYIKTTGADGMPQPLRIFEYKEISGEQGQTPVQTANAVTREEYEALRGKFDELTRLVEEMRTKGDEK